MALGSTASHSALGQSTFPPPEQFWKRYSRHHELPLSGVSSLALHLLGFALLALGGLIAAHSRWSRAEGPVLMGPVVEVNQNGSPENASRSESSSTQPLRRESLPATTESPVPSATQSNAALRPPSAAPLNLSQPDPNAQDQRLLKESHDAINQFEQQKRELHPLVPGTPGPGGPPGLPGPRGQMDVHVERQIRWQLNFQVRDARDQLDQLAALGAIVAIRDPNGDWRVFRNLRTLPPQGTIEDISHLDRICFLDDGRHGSAAAGVARLLGMPGAKLMAAFFPRELEERMARMEKEYRGVQDEAQLRDHIVFDVVPKGAGYEVIVRDPQP